MAKSEVRRIRVQLRNAVEAGGWHGPGMREIVGALAADEAASRPLPGAHSPWEIVLHVVAWLETVDRRLRGEEAELTAEEAWPPMGLAADSERAESAWSELHARLLAAHERLQVALAGMVDADLERPAPGRDHDMYFMLHGAIQHTLYHAGQIAILAKGVRPAAAAS